MKPMDRSLLAVVAALAATAAMAAPAQAGLASPTPSQAEELGHRAYRYGFPLLEFLRVRREQTSVRCPDREGNSPVNSFSNARGFATADDRTVVAPNTDTLYSIAHLDLRRPLVLSHPRMGDRYYSFELLDPYTNVIDIPGQREDGGGAGSYEIRWSGDGVKGRAKGVDRVITSKYRRVWVIGRTLATNERDQAKAQRKMKRYALSKPNGKPARTFPTGCKPGEPEDSSTPTQGSTFVAALNRALAKNPPPRRDRAILEDLARVGIGPGLSPDEAGLSPEAKAALYAGVGAEAASLPTAARLSVLQDAQKTAGWLLPAPNIGDYGTDYDFRAIVAVVGLGANTPEEAIYPTGITDGEGNLYNGANDYRLTFPPGETPPAKYFWSLTMYDSDGYLVANPIDRYSLGPSHPPLVKKPDGSVVIAIQGDEPTEPRVNWLPSPAGGFRLNLRLYGPSKAARTGRWRPPGVVKVGPAP
jgi:hypothetical protein